MNFSHLLRMEQSPVCSKSDFINDSWLQVNKDSSGNMFACPCLREEGCKGVIPYNVMTQRQNMYHLFQCHLLLSIYLKAWCHQVGFHVPDSKVPSKRYQFGSQPGQREQKYILSKH